jgi:hypothetical protein
MMKSERCEQKREQAPRTPNAARGTERRGSREVFGVRQAGRRFGAGNELVAVRQSPGAPRQLAGFFYFVRAKPCDKNADSDHL